MLRIRLQRSGRKKKANYRIVVAEHSAPIQGRYVEAIGSFDPLVEKHGLVIDADKLENWVQKGAKPTNTVARLLKGKGMKGMEPFIVEMKDRAVKNPKEEPEKPASSSASSESSTAEATASQSDAAETPASETANSETHADEKAEAASEDTAPESKADDQPAESSEAETPASKKEESAEPKTEEVSADDSGASVEEKAA